MSPRLGATAAGDDRARHAQVRRHILQVAGELGHDNGSPAVGLRQLARTVGIRPQSLYTYFASKNDLYDALTVDATEHLLAALHALPVTGAQQTVRDMTRTFVDYATADPARFSLLFQLAIPHYRHSRASQAGADEVLTVLTTALDAAGLDAPTSDVYIAAVIGLVSQQNTNQPGGTRWTGHLENLDALLLHGLTA